jgi:hypothetical protein
MQKTELKPAELATLVSGSLESSSAGGHMGVEVGRTSGGFEDRSQARRSTALEWRALGLTSAG